MIITPSLDSDILESITRDTLIKIFLKNDYEIEERHVSEKDLTESDEIFLCGTSAEITPIKYVETKDFKIGDLTKFISEEYQQAVRAKNYVNYNWTTKFEI